MNRSIITASVTMGQLQQKLDTIGHNLANTGTNGFKTRDARFNELMAQQVNNQPITQLEQGRRTPNGIRLGNGASVSETSLRLTTGSMKKTDRELDLALTKTNQFFSVQSVAANGQNVTRYTKDGAFYLSRDREIVTKDGEFVLGVNGPIVIPKEAKQIAISENGQVSVTYPDQTSGVVGQLAVVDVMRPQLLMNTGDNLYGLPDLNTLKLTQADILRPAANAAVKQFTLESSNVDIGAQMTEMMTAQRSYQFNAKSISIADQMMSLVNGIR